MVNKKFLLLQSNHMSVYSLDEIEHLDNVVIFHHKKVSPNRLINLLFNIHNSAKIQRFVNIPFKGFWDKIVFNKLLKRFVPDYIVFTTSWYSDHLLSYFRIKCKGSKLILRFSDLVSKGFSNISPKFLEKIKSQFDGVLVYSQEDASKYGFTYHSVGYSAIKKSYLKQVPQYDVVFIGAEKGRIEKIRQAHALFSAAGLSCFFYVIMVQEQDRKNDGIIYADKVMPFNEYLSYEISAKCLFELVQDGSSGRTYRMMEAIIYNKLLITNCQEIVHTNYYKKEYVQLYNDLSEINPSFIGNAPEHIDYCYKGDFSPIHVLDFIAAKW